MKKTRKSAVAKATRNTVLNVASHVESLKEEAERAWNQTKPRQQRISENFKNAGQKIFAFGEGVATGLREGVSEVKKRNKGKRDVTV